MEKMEKMKNALGLSLEYAGEMPGLVYKVEMYCIQPCTHSYNGYEWGGRYVGVLTRHGRFVKFDGIYTVELDGGRKWRKLY